MTEKQTIEQLAKRYKEMCNSPFADGYTFKAFEGRCAENGFTIDDVKNYIEKEKQERKAKRESNKPQRFYFTQEKIKYSKMYGYCVYRCHVYRLRKEDGMPQKIGHIDYQTGSTRGAVNEVFYFLTEKGLIPKEYYEKSAYYYESGASKQYPIYELM